MDISLLNMVNQNPKVIPNYELNRERTSVDIYLNSNKDLFIIGVVDNNYIHWASLTKTNEREKNEAIFNYIANEPFTFVSSPNLKGVPTYYNLKEYYRATLKRSSDKGSWDTPFGVRFGKSEAKYHGNFFAGHVATFLHELQNYCYYREMGGACEIMLDSWIAMLEKGKSDWDCYRRIEPLPKMIEKESYLRVSESETIRKKYLLLCEKLSAAYCRYMDVARGGMPPY